MQAPHITSVIDHLQQSAGIQRPWRTHQVYFDETTKVVHFWITRHPAPNVERKRRPWFFGRVAIPAAPAPHRATGPEMQWRHVNCMDYSCQIHTVDVLDSRHHELPWLGQVGLPFSNRLARQLFACIMEGMELSAICAVFDIAFADMWKFKHALDNGHVRFGYTPAKKRGTAMQPQNATGSSTVPDVSDPLWAQLIIGETNIHIQTLSFQLILTKLRQQVSVQRSDEVKLMKLRELHRYVERNERSLKHELNQIRELSRSESP